jgi:hypothetical protein
VYRITDQTIEQKKYENNIDQKSKQSRLECIKYHLLFVFKKLARPKHPALTHCKKGTRVKKSTSKSVLRQAEQTINAIFH